jgi:hypothetical protein
LIDYEILNPGMHLTRDPFNEAPEKVMDKIWMWSCLLDRKPLRPWEIMRAVGQGHKPKPATDRS